MTKSAHLNVATGPKRARPPPVEEEGVEGVPHLVAVALASLFPYLFPSLFPLNPGAPGAPADPEDLEGPEDDDHTWPEGDEHVLEKKGSWAFLVQARAAFKIVMYVVICQHIEMRNKCKHLRKFCSYKLIEVPTKKRCFLRANQNRFCSDLPVLVLVVFSCCGCRRRVFRRCLLYVWLSRQLICSCRSHLQSGWQRCWLPTS